ncbi:MAG: ABC transporter permease [Agriterribacter sp.]
MFQNYFKIAWRNLLKHKMYSSIKIGGFALGIAACLLIALYIKDELSYDQSWQDSDRIYRITGEYNNNGAVLTGAHWPPPMAKALKEDFPEVEKSGRLMSSPLFYCAGSNQFRRTDAQQNTYEEGFTYADQDMLDILKVPMVYGKRETALATPNTIVLSKRKADKYFPGEDPVGKTIILNNDKSRIYKIGGVMENFPSTSHIQYDFWLTMTGYQLWDGEQAGWLSSNYYTYLLVKPGTDAGKLQAKLKLLLEKYWVPALKSEGNVEADKLTQKAKLIMQPLKDVHLRSFNIDDELKKGDIRFVWLFGGIACFIVIIACINFVNLSTAKSANRAKEVGLRKVVGSYRFDLIRQFLAESILFSILAFVIGVLLTVILLPSFNTLAGKTLTFPWTAWWLVPFLMVAALVIGIIAGVYPSFYLSSFNPVKVLKGEVSRGTKSSLIRNGLVVFQFATSIILIIGTLVIYNQTKYILNKKIGFDKDQVLLIQGTHTLGEKTQNFKDELLKLSQVKNVSVSDYLPVAGTKRNGNTFFKEGKTKVDIGVPAQIWSVDRDYVKTMGIKITEGRDFLPDAKSDSMTLIVNRTMADKMGLSEPLGQRVTNGWQTFTIVGVADNFNFESLREDVTPLCMTLGNNRSTIVSVKMNTTDAKNTIASITSIWKSFAPDQPIRYTFMDESFATMYADVQRMGYIFTSFAVFAIIIACLGLFALSAFMAEQRNKEIGIRKVLGASVGNITAMLSGDFVKLVAISILVASPIAWWAMTKWLQDFAYRISVSWWMIAVAGIAAILIALITISFQSVKAALMNPVKALRSE